MPDLSAIASALPIGLLFFLGTFLGWHRRRSGHRRAARELPSLAARLGLSLVGSRGPGTIGRITGTLNGYAVLVDPDERSRLVVRFSSPPGIDCRSYARGKRPPRGLDPFDSRSKTFDRLMKDRFAREELAEALEARAEPLERAVAAVLGAVGKALQELSIRDDAIECVVDFGKPPYIPAPVVKKGLEALTGLARLVEEAAETAAGPSDGSPRKMSGTSSMQS